MTSFPHSPRISFDSGEPFHSFDARYARFKTNPCLNTLLELLFKIEARGSTVKQEIHCGVLGFVTVASILAVNPSLLVNAGYDKHDVTSATALFAGLACIATGILSNLPFIMMPVLGTSIYMSVYMSQRGLTVGQGNLAVFFLGVVLSICSWRPISSRLAKIIPKSTNTGIYIGVGLLCALEVRDIMRVV
jgi:AGZA family xanthine/uracil permease-like MFS transporter